MTFCWTTLDWLGWFWWKAFMFKTFDLEADFTSAAGTAPGGGSCVGRSGVGWISDISKFCLDCVVDDVAGCSWYCENVVLLRSWDGWGWFVNMFPDIREFS